MMRYKKYIVFAWDDHYPAGGLHDIKDSFDTIEAAKAWFASHDAPQSATDNREIVDRDTWEVVWP